MMYKMFALLVMLVGLFTLVNYSQSRSSNDPVTQSNLISVATATLEAESNLFVTGAAEDGINYVAMKSQYDQAVKDREVGEAEGFYYKNPKSDVTDIKLEIGKNSASLFLIEQRQRIHVSPSGEETHVEEIIDHRFDFSFKRGKWVLESDTHLNGPKQEPLKMDEMPISDTSTDVSDFISFETPSNDRASASSVSVIRSWISSYAYQYYRNPNPIYRTFGNDCTNFTSQALTAGGWTQSLGFYSSDSAWWYKSSCVSWLEPCQSYPWAGAYNNYRYIRYQSGRATLASNINKLRAGDILQVDWDGGGTVDHSMVVTKVVNGLPYLTYRSNPVKDKPFSELNNAYPQAKWYGFNLKASY